MVTRIEKPALSGGVFPLYILAFILGVMLYFVLPTEPRVWHIFSLSIVIAVFAILVIAKDANWTWATGLTMLWISCVLLGVGYSSFKTTLIDTPFWDGGKQQRVWVVGTAEQVNLRKSGFATVLLNKVTTYNNGNTQEWPGMIISMHNSRAKNIASGSEVSAQARLSEPSRALHPEQFSWRQKSFFDGVSATGVVMGDLYVTPSESVAWQQNIRTFRENTAQKLQQTENGGVAAALLTGIRGGIPPQTQEDYRKSGLAHLMAISGMHLGMVAGAIYLLFAWLLVRSGSLPLHLDIRKIAAFGGLLTAAAYTLLAGASVPTLRALAMISAAFFAMLIGRLHLGVRILALVALGIALYKPHLIVGASFQLSFAAALALLFWVYARNRQRIYLGVLTPKNNRLWDMIQVSLVATLATAPLVAFHFKQVALLGVIANMLAIPLLAIAVLPLGFLYLLSPEAVADYILPLFLDSVGVLNKIAAFVADLPASYTTINSDMLLLLFVGSWGLLLAFIVKQWRVAGIALLSLMPLFLANQSAGASILVLDSGKIILAAQDNQYQLLYSEDKIRKKTLSNLIDKLPRPENSNKVCINDSCVFEWSRGQRLLATSGKSDISMEDCHLVEWVVAPINSYVPCPSKNLLQLVDNEGKNLSVYIGKDIRIVQQELPAKGIRPWL